ncbi:MAG: YaaL family protein [Oscillospiraceae bacterium]|jgi:hypothetical protein|nr:YaaL family protein [Oscillospiraceae bacterium]
MAMINEWARRFRHHRQEPERSPQEQLIEDIREVRRQMEGLQTYFSLETNEDLLDAAIYQREALEARYRYLLRQAKESSAVAAGTPIVAEERERWIN